MARVIGRLACALLVMPFVPPPLSAQRVSIRAVEVRSMLDVDVCSASPLDTSGILTHTLEKSGSDRSAAIRSLAQLEDSLGALAPARPSDVGLQFELAMVLAARTDLEGGTAKLRTAEALLAQLHRVLALDPSHPGARYVLGRLNAAVMRMSRVRRFVATKILGASALSGASWDEARRLLESAADSDPCLADARYELARLYVDRGEPGLAEEQLERLARVRTKDPHGRAVVERGRTLLETLRDH